MKIYRDRQQLIRPFFLGVSFSYISIDNIVTGPLRKYLIEFLKIGEFGSNMREEWLYYFILFLGVTQLYIALQSLFLPVIKDIDEITEINSTEDSELVFSFQDNSYTIYAEDLLTEDIETLKSHLSF